MNKKFIERTAPIAFAAFLVGMFFYQVAHATSFSNYLNGTMTETLDNGTTVTLQPGTPEYEKHLLPMNITDFGNSTWTIYNATSGSVGKITFHEEMIGGFMHNDTWTRTLNGHVYKGFFIPPMGSGGYSYLQLCRHVGINSSTSNPPKPYFNDVCASLHITVKSSDHMEFKDAHNDTIHLIR